jgi:hypothetical protein
MEEGLRRVLRWVRGERVLSKGKEREAVMNGRERRESR